MGGMWSELGVHAWVGLLVVRNRVRDWRKREGRQLPPDHMLPWNSEETKKSECEPGFPGYCENVFVKVGE